jgi:hypothetical protein
MKDYIQNFQDLMSDSKNILLIFPQIINSDICASISLIYKILTTKYDKKVEIVSPRAIPARFHDILTKSGIKIENIQAKIEPVTYLIDIKDANKDDVSVDFEKSDKKLQIRLTTQVTDLDLKKISVSTTGGLYDLAISFNVHKLEDLGNIYTDNQVSFNKFEMIAISTRPHPSNYAKLSIFDGNYTTTSEVVFKLAKELEYNLTNADATIIAEGILGSTFGLHHANKKSTFKVVSELINKYKVDFAGINTKYFYSFSKEELKLKERLLAKVKYDDTKSAIYSTLSKSDFVQTSTNPSDLDGMDYLPFNIVKGYDIAFIAYEVEDKTYILAHSNSKSTDLNNILRNLSGYSTGMFGFVALNENLETAVTLILSNIQGESKFSDESLEAIAPAVVTPESLVEQEIFDKPETINVTPEPVKPVINRVPTAPKFSIPEPVMMPNNAVQLEDSEPITVDQTQTPSREVVLPTQPQIQGNSPFVKAQNFVVDENASAVKTPQSGYAFTAVDKPF